MSTEKTATETSFQIETTAAPSQLAARDQILDLFQKSPLPPNDLLFNLGLYTRSSLLVKYLVLSDIYKRFRNIPGLICEFGTWWGQNLVLLENLRAIYEPFNKQRRILGFDTFTGYTPLSSQDKPSAVWEENSYATGKAYKDYLESLLKAHEGSNVLGHIKGLHQLIEGNIIETVPAYFHAHPESLVAFAYFDLGLYEPTFQAMKAIKPHLMPGSILLLDELTWQESPGEAIAFKKVFANTPYRIEKIEMYPSKSIVTIL